MRPDPLATHRDRGDRAARRSLAQNLRRSVRSDGEVHVVEQENRSETDGLAPISRIGLERVARGSVLAYQLHRSQERTMIRAAAIIASLLGILTLAQPAFAHCDTTQGPVVTAARDALEANDPNLVLHWVRPEDEAVVRSAFEHTVKVRALGQEAKELADRYFFETLVRIHRAGEGAPYTGLTDGEPEPIIAATDRALEQRSAQELEQQLVSAVKAGLAERFAVAQAAKSFRAGDIAGGRTFVAAYVPLTHWVEGVFTAAKAGDHHAAAPGAESAHAVVHSTGEHGAHAGVTEAHGSDAHQVLPWMLAGLLAIAALVEGAFLLRRTRPAAA
jgi:hypothetical protein